MANIPPRHIVKRVVSFKNPHKSPRRPIHSHSTVIDFHIDIPKPTTAKVDHRDLVRAQKLAELSTCLSWTVPNPSRVWAHYLAAVNVMGYRDVPLEVHRDVLRKCTPSSAEVRVAAARYIRVANTPLVPHIHEERFKVVIRNIRAAGWTPSLDDYHFIFEHFAATGHHIGMMHVYQELTHKGLQPRTKTYGICLQAIAHRLTLPCTSLRRPALILETRKQCADLLKDMCTSNTPFTSVNVDLAVRILKETLDEKAFDLLMKTAYGIDLANPDRSFVGLLDKSDLRSSLGEVLQKLPSSQPFSTAALNTTIDMLGRFGGVSKLVQTFEVLTQPLPSQACQLFSSFFLDDDDYSPSVSDVRLPNAKPNTTTYNMLLRYVSKAGHAVFARHYLLQAIQLEWETDRALRGDLMRKPLHEVLPPHFAINRGTLLSVFGECNRDKNTQLMRWLSSKLPKILRRKRANFAWYTYFRASLPDTRQHEAPAGDRPRSIGVLSDSHPHGLSLSSSNPETPLRDEPPIRSPPSEPSLSSSDDSTYIYHRASKVIPIPVLELDLDAPPIQSPPINHFDINLHLKILQRDIAEIELFATYVKDTLGRTTQRVKERLGRRVWQGKNIYLLTNGERRIISRSAWREMVQFKPRYGFSPTVASDSPLGSRREKHGPPYARSGWIAGHRGLTTLRVLR